MKKAVCLILCVLLVFIASFSVYAVPDIHYRLYRDVDFDDQLTIVDVTRIQLYLSRNIAFGVKENFSGDFDHDQMITIIDATYIQWFLSNLELPENYGGFYNQNLPSIKLSYKKDPAFTDEPTEFLIVPEFSYYSSVDNIHKTELYIEDKLVDECLGYEGLSYVFDKIGYYKITVRLYNYIDEIREFNSRLFVVDKNDPDKIYLPGIAYFEEDYLGAPPNISVDAFFGQRPYEYSYKITGLSETDIINYKQTTDFVLNNDDYGYYLYMDFSEKSYVNLPVDNLTNGQKYTIIVQAKDNNDVLSNFVTKDIVFLYQVI